MRRRPSRRPRAVARRSPVAAVLVALAVVGMSAAPGGSGPAVPARRPASAATPAGGAAAAEGAGLYVLAYDGDAVTPDQVTRTVDRAGGDVVDVLAPLDAALVAAPGGPAEAALAAADGVESAVRNHSVGTAGPGRPHRFAGELPLDEAPAAHPGSAPVRAGTRDAGTAGAAGQAPPAGPAEPFGPEQWGMVMLGATPDGAHATATGRGVEVGIIDTGIDGSHPDLAPNLDTGRSTSFVSPAGPGRPCTGIACTPADASGTGHGTHIAGVVAAARNDLGIAGVAPDAELVDLRAGTDGGYFFVYEVAAALVRAGDLGLDVVNMSFFTDPWLYNCDSADDYISGTVTPDDIAEQATVRRLMLDALDYAHRRGVTLVAAAGNQHADMSSPVRQDVASPDYPPGTARPRVVTDDCLDLPAEGPDVITVASVGPSGAKAAYSNHGAGSVDLAAPGGWFRDQAGTDRFQDPGNMILSSYPRDLARHEGAADGGGEPTDGFGRRDCRADRCGFYRYLQGTSMAAPFVTGVAALVVERHGAPEPGGGRTLAPDRVADILTGTAEGRPCPPGGVADYAAAGRPSSWRAPCTGDAGYNSLYGHGVVSAANAVR